MFTCLDCHLLPLLEKFQNVCSEVILNTDFRGASQKAGVKSPRRVSFTFQSLSFPLLQAVLPWGWTEAVGRAKGMERSERKGNGEIRPVLPVSSRRGTGKLNATKYLFEGDWSYSNQITPPITVLNCFLFEWIETSLISHFKFSIFSWCGICGWGLGGLSSIY